MSIEAIKYDGEAISRRHLFFGALLVVTLIPLVGLTASNSLGFTDADVFKHFAIPLFLGGFAHVTATAYLYADNEIRELMRDHPLRFIAVPITLVVAGALLFHLADVRLVNFVLLVYFVWQLHHYQRQNYGILAFAMAAENADRPPRLMSLTMNLATAAGVMGAIGAFADGERNHGVLVADYIAYLRIAGFIVYIAVVALLVYLLATHEPFRRSPWSTAFAVISALFFMPTLFATSGFPVFMSYAVAHGLQYLIFIGIVGSKSPRPVINLAIATIACVIGGLLMERLVEFSSGTKTAVFGALIGLVASHFVIDAGIWRMRDPAQRALLKRRFAFLFAR